MKIATHDSATGERSKNLLHALVKVFAQTQTKTIKEQYEAGCRYFDLRVDKDLVLCHGLWKADKDLPQLLTEMARYVDDEGVYMTVCIERKYNQKTYDTLCKAIRQYINLRARGRVKLVYIANKLPQWNILAAYRSVAVKAGYLSVPTPKQYFTLTFKDWRRYIPIPRVLKMVTPKLPCERCEDDYFVMIDFL